MDQALSEDNESWISLKEELRARLAPEEICMETHFYSLDVFTVGDQNSSATHDSRQPRVSRVEDDRSMAISMADRRNTGPKPNTASSQVLQAIAIVLY